MLYEFEGKLKTREQVIGSVFFRITEFGDKTDKENKIQEIEEILDELEFINYFKYDENTKDELIEELMAKCTAENNHLSPMEIRDVFAILYDVRGNERWIDYIKEWR